MNTLSEAEEKIAELVWADPGMSSMDAVRASKQYKIWMEEIHCIHADSSDGGKETSLVGRSSSQDELFPGRILSSESF